MRELLAEAIEPTVDIASLRQRLGKLLTERSFESHQLDAAYLAAASHFLGLSFKAPAPHQLPNGLPLEEWAGHLHGKQVPHLLHAIELGILWALLGVVHKRDDYTIASLKVAHWFLNLLDLKATLMVGIWLPALDFSQEKLRASLHLLLQIASQISGDVRFERALKVVPRDLEPLMQKIGAYLLPKIEKQIHFPLSLILEEMTVGVLSHHARDWSAIFSLSGHQSGMGAVHRRDVKIAAIGPQKGPLDDLSTFGISRRPPFKEVGWEKSSTGALLQGWTQTDGIWVQMAAAIGPDEVHLEVRGEVKENTYMVFYAQGSSLLVDGARSLKRGELMHYRAPASEIVIKGDQEKIRIQPSEPHMVEILPLCGGNSFYDSDFLIAFPWRQDHLQWKINF